MSPVYSASDLPGPYQNVRRRGPEKINRRSINWAELIKTAENEKSPTRKSPSGLKFFEREKGLEPSTSTLARPGMRSKVSDLLWISV
jgi:hypothetical protein